MRMSLSPIDKKRKSQLSNSIKRTFMRQVVFKVFNKAWELLFYS